MSGALLHLLAHKSKVLSHTLMMLGASKAETFSVVLFVAKIRGYLRQANENVFHGVTLVA